MKSFQLLFIVLLSGTMFVSCTKKDTLRIFAHQASGSTAFGAAVDIYPSETNYLSEPVPVVSGQANTQAENGQAVFEIEELFNGQHFFDIVFQDSIGNWGISGAENTFTALADGGELIDVGGGGLALNYHRLLLPQRGESTWRLVDIQDTNGNSIFATAPACITDNGFVLRKNLTLEHFEGSSVCGGAAQTQVYDFAHGGNTLSVQNFEGQSGTTTFAISPALPSLVAQVGNETWIYRRD